MERPKEWEKFFDTDISAQVRGHAANSVTFNAFSEQVYFMITSQFILCEWVLIAFVVSVARTVHKWILELGLGAQRWRLTVLLYLQS